MVESGRFSERPSRPASTSRIFRYHRGVISLKDILSTRMISRDSRGEILEARLTFSPLVSMLGNRNWMLERTRYFQPRFERPHPASIRLSADGLVTGASTTKTRLEYKKRPIWGRFFGYLLSKIILASEYTGKRGATSTAITAIAPTYTYSHAKGIRRGGGKRNRRARHCVCFRVATHSR